MEILKFIWGFEISIIGFVFIFLLIYILKSVVKNFSKPKEEKDDIKLMIIFLIGFMIFLKITNGRTITYNITKSINLNEKISIAEFFLGLLFIFMIMTFLMSIISLFKKNEELNGKKAQLCIGSFIASIIFLIMIIFIPSFKNSEGNFESFYTDFIQEKTSWTDELKNQNNKLKESINNIEINTNNLDKLKETTEKLNALKNQ